MKMKSLRNRMAFAMLTLGMFFAISCEQSELSKVEPDVRLENGRVVFKDDLAFENTMNMLHTYEVEQIEQWEKGLGHDSYRNSDLFLTEDEVVHDNQFAAILNENAEYQIGNTIHKITHEIEYMIPIGKEEALISKDFSDNDIEKFEIINKNFDLKDEKGNSLEAARGPWGTITTKLQYASDRRFKLQGWNQTFVNYANCGVRTIFQRQNFLNIWYNSNAHEIGFTNIPNGTKAKWRYFIGSSYTTWLEKDIPTTRRSNQKDHSYTVGHTVGTLNWCDVESMTTIHYIHDGYSAYQFVMIYE